MWEGPNMRRDASLLYNGEVCKLIEGYGKYMSYYVSNTGKVWRDTTEILQSDVQGYMHVGLTIGLNNRPTFRVHILVANAFIENPFKGLEIGVDYVVDHIDGNKTNNHLSNLRFVKMSENTLNVSESTKKKNGTLPKVVQRVRLGFFSIPIEIIVNECSVREMARIVNCTKDMISKACKEGYVIDGHAFRYKRVDIHDRRGMVMLNRYCTLKQVDINSVSPPSFVQIRGFSAYFVTQYGDIWTSLKQRWIVAYCDVDDPKSYWKVHILPDDEEKGKTVRVHRCVCVAFHINDDPEEKDRVNHIDANSRNPHYENLEWCTASRNSKHAVDEGCNKRVVRMCQFTQGGVYMTEHNSIDEARRSIGRGKGTGWCDNWYTNSIFLDSNYIWARKEVCIYDRTTNTYTLPTYYNGKDILREKEEKPKSPFPFFYGGPKIPNPVFSVTRQ